MRRRAAAWLALPQVLALALGARPAEAEGPLSVGSKAFAESWILGEAVAELARRSGASPVVHRSNLGGTEIVYQALRSGSVDVYPEYTGTIGEVMLGGTGVKDPQAMRAALAERGIGMGEPLGFNDGYAIAVSAAVQERLGVRTLSDLARHPELRLGLTHEFLGRRDGFPGLARHYGLAMRDVRGLQHELAYTAIASGTIDAMDIYTTDAQIRRLGLRVLADDRGFFPRYDAVLLYRLDLPRRAPAAFAAMRRLEGRVDESLMIECNAMVVLERRPYQEAAARLVERAAGAGTAAHAVAPATPRRGWMGDLVGRLIEHVRLVAVSLGAAIALGIPLGVLAARSRPLAAVTLTVAGLLQTIPSLALLAFLIPFLGVGLVPALVALFLYGLLPIVRNTYVGLTTIPTPLIESAEALALSPRARLWWVMLPMASPTILAGIKISAVVNVGTATLAALIGAGGLGDPILSGIQLRDTARILQGAVPAAALALAVQAAFDALERVVVPRGLRP